MSVETIAKGFALSVVLLIAVGCTPTNPEFPTGEFVDSEGNIVNYRADGTLTLSVPGSAGEFLSGEYSVEGDTITSSDGFCPGVAVYKWSFDGERLEFELVSDDCPERRASAAGGLTRISEDN